MTPSEAYKKITLHRETIPKLSIFGKVIGEVEILKPIEYQQTYETAGWYSLLESDTGIFPLQVGLDYYNDKIQLYSKIPAVTREEFTPHSFGRKTPQPLTTTKKEFQWTICPLEALQRNHKKWGAFGQKNQTYDIRLHSTPEVTTVVEKTILCLLEKQTYLAACLEDCLQQHKWNMVAHYANCLETHSQKIRGAIEKNQNFQYILETPELA